jgi:MFS family permease
VAIDHLKEFHRVSDSIQAAPSAVGLRRLLVCILPATTAMYALYQGIQQVLIPLQVQNLDPEHKVANLAVLTAVSAITSLLALPLGGALSDGTRGRFGRRTPWLIASALGTFLLLAIIGNMTSLLSLAVVYSLLWFFANFYQGAWAGILPDRVTESRRGIASSVIGFGTPLGILIGVNYVSHVSQNIAYVSLGLFLVVATALLVFGAPEGPYNKARKPSGNTPADVPKLALRFFVAFKSRDYSLAFASRFCLYLAYFIINGYLLYILQDWIGIQNVPGQNAAVGVGILVSVNTFAWILLAGTIGWIADRLDRRKLFVGIAAIGMALSSLIPILFPTWTGMIVFAALIGAFKGAYLAVDLALMSLVLPDKAHEGRDMALLSIATGTPQLVSGAAAGALITFFNGYSALFVAGFIIAAIAGVIAFFIRSVR